MAKILMVASEAAPFCKTGGLADVLGALPKALAQLGEEVAVVLPLYRQVSLKEPKLVGKRVRLPIGQSIWEANILAHDEAGVRYFFVDIPSLYDREGLYDQGGAEYPDNHIRFGALCYGALAVARYFFLPQIIHGHDWQAGLLPVLLREVFTLHPAYSGVKLAFTIHNLGYQGLFPPSAITDLGLPPSLFQPDGLEFYGSVNLLKGGIRYSDALTTVSPRYAEEIQTPEFGFGLDGLLRSRRDVLTGILNGVDYDTWNPATDPSLAARYDTRHLEAKQECKLALLAEMGLPQTLAKKPLVGIVSRFAEQKGFDLLEPIPHELAREDFGMVVLGSGEKRYEDFFRWFAATYPEKVAVRIGYNNDLAHRIEAGADLFLMPSRYEPCGLNQIYSLRYGTLPLVRATGGLDDTIDAETGFKFRAYSSQELLETLQAAFQVYGTKKWLEMIRTAMGRSFLWQASARQYSELYRRLVASNG